MYSRRIECSAGYVIDFYDDLRELQKCIQSDERHGVVLVDSEVYNYWKEWVEGLKKSVFVVSSGEEHKTIRTVEAIWDFFMRSGVDRESVVWNVGGGVIGDMGGFAASTFMRGVKFVQVPTTLLAMVDASVGGKTAIDYHQVKNLIGSFSFPAKVLIAQEFLKTLPERHIFAGKAEMYKHALIYDRNGFYAYDTIDTDLLYEHVRIKEHFVSQDTYEKGVRKALNLGHTLGHALESFALFNGVNLLHGEAVAIGILIEAMFAMKKELLPLSAYESIKKILFKEFAYLKNDLVSFAYTQATEEILQRLYFDKKKQQDTVRMPLLTQVGSFSIEQVRIEEFSDFLNEHLNSILFHWGK